MKFVKVLMSFALMLFGATVAVATDNVLLGIASIPIAGTLVQTATGVSLMEGSGVYAVLATLPRTPQQTLNPGGIRRIFVIATDNLNGYWPKPADITGGEITAAPTLQVGPPVASFVEFQISDNSGKLDESLKGATGYQSWEQALEFKVAGYTKEQCMAIEKLINVEVLVIAVMNDGQRVVLGNSFSGLQFEITHTTGAKGGDRREWTLKAKQDGLMNGYLPLANTVTIPGVAA